VSTDHAAIATSPHSPAWPADEPWHLAMPEGTLYQALVRAANDRPAHPATVFYGASVTYGWLRSLVDALTGFLQSACGVMRVDRVLIAHQNSPQYVIAYCAVMRADAVIAPVNPMNKTTEIEYLGADGGAKIAIIGSELCTVFTPLVGDAIADVIVAQYRDEVPSATPYTLPRCVTEAPSEVPSTTGWHSSSSAITHGLQPGAIEAGPDDLMILPSTSGMTGKPKACMHSHRSALLTAVLQARWYGLGGDDMMTGFLPLFHVAGMQGSMNAAVVAGATLLLMARWDKDLPPDLFETYGVTFWNAAKGRLGLGKLVDLTATAPAKIYNLHPRKGSIAVGADADIAIWDPAREVVLADAVMHDLAGYTPYTGRKLRGWPVTVLSRGRVVVADGKRAAEPGSGRFLARSGGEAAKPTGRLVADMDPARNFGARLL
jgi:fatty-acyl-CoA synthase